MPSISIQYWYPTTRILIIAYYRFFKSIDLRSTSFILITLKSHVQFTTQPISKPLLGDSYPRLHTRQRRVHHVWNFYKTNDLATHLKRFYLFSFYWVALSIRFLFSLSYVNQTLQSVERNGMAPQAIFLSFYVRNPFRKAFLVQVNKKSPAALFQSEKKSQKKLGLRAKLGLGFRISAPRRRL